MAEFPQQVRTQFIDFVRRLSFGQRIALGGVSMGALAAIVMLVTMVNRPTYGTLFSNLAAQDASKIVVKLQEKKIPYQIEDDGKTITIPKDKIYDVRLSLAGEGLPQSSVIGYEIFDRTNLGVSDFVQKINYRRALEGEIARTILQLEEVEGARVHIVVPDKSLFKEDEKAATASVVLKLRSSKSLRKESVQGIIHLIASSVEGLDPGNVTIVDSRGTMLSETDKGNSLGARTSTQYELQQKVETYIAQKAQNMLEDVVGRGNAHVQVTADLDFRQVDRTLEQYDPEKTVVRSEQTTEEKNILKDSIQPSTRSNTVTNYEVNKTLAHVIENVGGIKRLSVAAIVNGTRVEVENNGQKVSEYRARKSDEMNQLGEVVKRAVGFDSSRHDEVSVINLPFGDVDAEGFLYKDSPSRDWKHILDDDNYGKLFILVAMVGAVAMLWLLLKKFRAVSLAGGDDFLGQQVNVVLRDGRTSQLGTGQGAKGSLHGNREKRSLPPAEDMISENARLRVERQDRITEYIQRKPNEAGRLLKVWLTNA